MQEIKAPNELIYPVHTPCVFLAGSIEMGLAEPWQERLVKWFEHKDVVFYNPRRTDWDSSWRQDKTHTEFRKQVEWELDAMELADLVVYYFDPATKAPITLMELGIHASKNPTKCIVCCPEGYWRKGNVDIVCEKYGVMVVSNWTDFVDAIGRNI